MSIKFGVAVQVPEAQLRDDLCHDAGLVALAGLTDRDDFSCDRVGNDAGNFDKRNRANDLFVG